MSVLALWAAARHTEAHGPIPEQIASLTVEIGAHPDSADLYLRRAELHRIEQDWEAASADYLRSTALGGGDAVDLGFGRMLLEAGWAGPAKAVLDGLIEKHPDHGEALAARAQAHVALGEFDAAARDYDRALAATSPPEPDWYVERARAAERAGYVDEALAGLDDGIRKLGPLVVFEQLAVELDRSRHAYESALARVDRILEQSPRKETWLARRGDLLREAGRPQEARRAFAAALAALEALPPPRRNVRAMSELENSLKEQLRALSAGEDMRLDAPH